MKRTRKTRKTLTLTQKRGLVNKVITLLNKGAKLTHARQEVARNNNTTEISLARWAKDRTVMTTLRADGKRVPIAKSNGKMANRMTPYRQLGDKQLIHTADNVNIVHVTGVDLHVPGKGIIKLDQQLLTHISKLAGYTG